MKRFTVRLGPLAILFTVIALCLSTLSILTFSTARAEKALSERYADTIRVRYELEKQGQELLGEINAALRSEDTAALLKMQESGLIDVDGNQISAKIEEGSTGLYFGGVAGDNGQGLNITQWCIIKDWEEDTSAQNIWDGQKR